MAVQKITPFLWSDGKAEEMARYYCEIVPNSKVISVNPVVTVFELAGVRFSALNGGPMYQHSPAFSIMIDCEDQAEVDRYWNKFIDDGGVESRCAWLTDKFGVSWQIVPKRLMQLLSDADAGRRERAMQAMFKMSKIIIADMEAAADAA
ncbi:VOC family protein [Terricaulis sp.]|uniref:VOC family protein n=1 Tax=Terricaulis sp. TaxID=2768686 RepID=UPI003784B812